MKRAMRRRKTWQRQTAAITAAMMAMSVGGIAYAMPQGEVIRSGKGEITRQDKDMTVNQDSKRLAIDWAGFDIANDERVTFRQPDRDSVALNRVVGDAASVIDGALSGNGHVYVINPNGVLFGKNASVDVGSLVASTARISDRDMTNFAGADGITMAIPEDSSAKVINAGTIRAEGGLVVLHAAEVENSGTITNPEGTTALAAARNLSLSADTAGKINFTVDGALAKAKALNSGMLKADGGYLVMTARSAGDVMSTVVNNTGTMEAKTLRQNEKGEILLDGQDLTKFSVKQMNHIRGNEISVIFQEPMTSLNPVFSVDKQLSEPFMIHQGMNKKEAHEHALQMLYDVQIPNPEVVIKQYPHQLSGGMRQRVMIAMALACKPKILIADEPTTALDVTIQAQVLDMMNELKSKLGTSVLMITHDLGIIAEMCDRVAVIYAGEVVELGNLEDIFHQTAHPYTQGLFDSLPNSAGDSKRLKPIKGLMPDPANLPVGCKFCERCPYATEECSKTSPELTEITPGHWVRCYHQSCFRKEKAIHE